MLHWTRTLTLHGSTEAVDAQKHHQEEEQCIFVENSPITIKSSKLVHEKKEGNVIVVFSLCWSERSLELPKPSGQCCKSQ